MKILLLVFISISIAVAYPSGYEMEVGGGGGYGGGGRGGGYDDGGGSAGYVYHKQGKHNYDFGYDVKDPYYGSHSRKEKKEDGYVTGTYSYQDKDGSTVVVDYEADPKNGYRATVKDKNGVTQYGYDSHGDDGGKYEEDGGKYDEGGKYDNGYGQMGGGGGGGKDGYY